MSAVGNWREGEECFLGWAENCVCVREWSEYHCVQYSLHRPATLKNIKYKPAHPVWSSTPLRFLLAAIKQNI
jgi:hypothetical protein